MTLNEYITLQITTGRADTRREVMHWIASRLLVEGVPISVTTLGNLDRGGRLESYRRAAALERVTEGAVTVKELCT